MAPERGARKGTLHGVSLSPFVRKVRIVAGLKGIDYELVSVMPGAVDERFRSISPLAKIPVWEEEGFTLPDSSVICAYLDRCVPEPPILPSEARAAATSLFWEEYADTRLVEAAAPVFFQRVVHARIFGQPADEDLVRRHLEEVLPPVFDQLERLFLAPDLARDAAGVLHPTIGALSVWSVLVNLAHAEVEPDAGGWPRLAAFYREMGTHALLAGLLAEERAALAAH